VTVHEFRTAVENAIPLWAIIALPLSFLGIGLFLTWLFDREEW